MNEIEQLLHDVRNPLNNIAMNAELAKMILDSQGDQKRLGAAIEVILKECRKCGELLDGYQAD